MKPLTLQSVETLCIIDPRISGYNSFNQLALKAGLGRPSGGISIFTKEGFDVTIISKKGHALHVYLPELNVTIISFYFKPGMEVANIVDSVTSEVNTIRENSKTVGWRLQL